MRAHKGQSTVEYILLVTAVIAVVILFTSTPNGLFSQEMLNVATYLQDNAAPQ